MFLRKLRARRGSGAETDCSLEALRATGFMQETRGQGRGGVDCAEEPTGRNIASSSTCLAAARDSDKHLHLFLRHCLPAHHPSQGRPLWQALSLQGGLCGLWASNHPPTPWPSPARHGPFPSASCESRRGRSTQTLRCHLGSHGSGHLFTPDLPAPGIRTRERGRFWHWSPPGTGGTGFDSHGLWSEMCFYQKRTIRLRH